MTNAQTSQRTSNRRTALSVAARYLNDAGTVFADYRAWEEEVTGLADRLLPWLNADLEASDDDAR